MSSNDNLAAQIEAIKKDHEELKKLMETKLRNKTKEEESKEKFEKKKDYTDLVLSVAAFLISVFSVIFTVSTYNKTSAEQQETQAYNYWQNFLQLAVQKPEMANGDDSEYFERNKNDSLKRVEYAWFVANALGAAEIVFRLQKDDKDWRNTLKEIISLHSQYIRNTDFDSSHYSSDFYKLVQEATQKTN